MEQLRISISKGAALIAGDEVRDLLGVVYGLVKKDLPKRAEVDEPNTLYSFGSRTLTVLGVESDDLGKTYDATELRYIRPAVRYPSQR
jgi:hypothetical protein